MSENRGTSLLVGLAAIYVIYRLVTTGWFDDIKFLLTCYSSGVTPDSVGAAGLNTSPIALLFSVFIESTIAVGTVVTLVVSGLWDVLLIAGGWIRDTLMVFQGYLKDWAKSRATAAKEKPVVQAKGDAAVEPAVVEDPPKIDLVLQAPSTDEVLMAAIRDTRAGLKEVGDTADTSIKEINKRLDGLSDALTDRFEKTRVALNMMYGEFKAFSGKVLPPEPEVKEDEVSPDFTQDFLDNGGQHH